MAKEPDQKKSVSEQKREAVIAAAVECFSASGFKATSMDSIAAPGGVSKRTVYNHFASKELLFQEIINQLLDSSQKASCQPYSAQQPLVDQLMIIATAELKLFADLHYQKVARVMMVECIRSPELTASALSAMSDQESGLQRWLTGAIADGRIKSVDTARAARQFFSLLKANAFWPQLLEGAASLTEAEALEAAQEAVGMFLAFYQVR